jgi:hypothetical protein
MPNLTQHNKHMIQASKWGDVWRATCNDASALTFEAETPEEAINMMKEYLDND